MLKIHLAALFIFAWIHFCDPGQHFDQTIKLQLDTVNAIIIRLPGKASIKDDDILAKITDKNRIAHITYFINKQLLNNHPWESESDRGALLPMPFINLECYYNKNLLLSFGIGIDFFYSMTSINGHRVSTLPQNGKKEFLDLINLSDEEYDRLYKERTKPGPWKKNP